MCLWLFALIWTQFLSKTLGQSTFAWNSTCERALFDTANLQCEACPSNQAKSQDGYQCMSCDASTNSNFDSNTGKCVCSSATSRICKQQQKLYQTLR